MAGGKKIIHNSTLLRRGAPGLRCPNYATAPLQPERRTLGWISLDYWTRKFMIWDKIGVTKKTLRIVRGGRPRGLGAKQSDNYTHAASGVILCGFLIRVCGGWWQTGSSIEHKLTHSISRKRAGEQLRGVCLCVGGWVGCSSAAPCATLNHRVCVMTEWVSERAPPCDLHFMEFLLRRPPGNKRHYSRWCRERGMLRRALH